jgi:hypothetical protein
VSRKNSDCSARTHACRVHTHVNARRAFVNAKQAFANVPALRVQPFTPPCVSARPRIVFHLRNQSCLHGVLLNIPRNSVPFVLIPHPVIVRFATPKWFACAHQQLICFSRGISFERLEQPARRYLRKQEHVNMVRHDRKWSKQVVAEFRAFEERIDKLLCDCFLLEKHWPGAGFVQIPVHPNEGFAGGTFGGRGEPGARQAAVQVPGDEQPAILGIDMGKPALRVHATISAISPEKLSNRTVAHALVRAVFALLRTQGCGNNHQGVHMSVNAARRNACATS